VPALADEVAGASDADLLCEDRIAELERTVKVLAAEVVRARERVGSENVRIHADGSAALAKQVLSVSGSLGQWVEIGGRRYGHVLDPRTGEAFLVDADGGAWFTPGWNAAVRFEPPD
jgi:hypothetical protein